jgi:LmbE family N-acetylglucosaminyl deacetylase
MLQYDGKARLLAISPHLDDAVLSFGASLARARQGGAEATVFTVFAGIPKPPYSAMAERLHASWGFSPDQDAPSCRRKEDIAALDYLGVNYRHGPFQDVIYRRSPDGQWLVGGDRRPAIGRRSPADNSDLIAEIKGGISSLIDELEPTLLVTCVANGNHIDHQITRDAALLAAREKAVPLALWQDLPYAADESRMPELPKGLQLGARRLESVGQDLRERKFQAVKNYVSQIAMLNGSQKDLFTKLDDHARGIAPDSDYVETIWPVVGYESLP